MASGRGPHAARFATRCPDACLRCLGCCGHGRSVSGAQPRHAGRMAVLRRSRVHIANRPGRAVRCAFRCVREWRAARREAPAGERQGHAVRPGLPALSRPRARGLDQHRQPLPVPILRIRAGYAARRAARERARSVRAARRHHAGSLYRRQQADQAAARDRHPQGPGQHRPRRQRLPLPGRIHGQRGHGPARHQRQRTLVVRAAGALSRLDAARRLAIPLHAGGVDVRGNHRRVPPGVTLGDVRRGWQGPCG